MLQAHKKYKVSKVLSRDVAVEPIEERHMKYIWAAYSKGSLSSLLPTGIKTQEFQDSFISHVSEAFHFAWVCEIGGKVTGLFLGSAYPGNNAVFLNGATWFPWATKRNIIEGTMCFLANIRHEMPCIFHCTMEHKKLYEFIAKHGIIRRVGTSFTAFNGPSAIFETRAKK